MLLMQKGLSYSDSLTYEIVAPDGTILIPDKQSKAIWRWSKQKFDKALKNDFIEFVKDKNTNEWKIYTKQYLHMDYDGNKINRGSIARSIIADIDGRLGTRKLQEYFKNKIFDNPKPEKLIYRFLKISTTADDIILDFFSGSATTAHAVMQLNAEDGGRRRFIMVQLPEPTDEKSEAYKAGYKTIAEIGKERIRRAGRKIKEENAGKEGIDDLDIGFRVLKIDSSNMKDIYYTPDEVSRESLFDTVDHIKEDRSPEDLLFGVLVDWGVDLTLPIRRETIGGKTVFFVGHDDLIACFDDDLDLELIKTLAKQDALRVVFKESGFRDDETKINTEQIFKQLAPSTDVRVI
jgi:adenine-specific DNA-methyltransferase